MRTKPVGRLTRAGTAGKRNAGPAQGLTARNPGHGFTGDDVAGGMGGNWLRFLRANVRWAIVTREESCAGSIPAASTLTRRLRLARGVWRVRGLCQPFLGDCLPRGVRCRNSADCRQEVVPLQGV